MKTRHWLCLLIVCLVLNLSACTQKPGKIDSEVTAFSYSYGSFFGGYWDYKIVAEDNQLWLQVTGANRWDLDVSAPIDPKHLQEIGELIDQQKIYQWNGFDKSDSQIMDGSSFTLEVLYENGETLTAHGYMKYPAHYEEGHAALVAYLKALVDQYLPEVHYITILHVTFYDEPGLNHFQLVKDLDSYLVFVCHYQDAENTSIRFTVDQSVSKELSSLLQPYDLYNWDIGQLKTAEPADEDYDFSITYADGISYYISGSYGQPENYYEVKQLLLDYFNALIEEHPQDQ